LLEEMTPSAGSVRGFTLIELMVTVAVMAIIATIALPSFIGWYEQNRVRNAVEAVANHLQYTHSETIKLNRDLDVVVSSGADWCLVTTNTGSSCTCGSSCNYGPASALSSHYTSGSAYSGVSLSNSKTSYTFKSPSGLTPGDNDTLTVSSGVYSASVKLSFRGLSRICSDTIKAYPSCT
jgi:prepilin-type N-terminal cleavage/methylation domain-containing protein